MRLLFPASVSAILLSASIFLLSTTPPLEDCMSERAADLILPYDPEQHPLTAHSFVQEDGTIVSNLYFPDAFETACIRALHGAQSEERENGNCRPPPTLSMVIAGVYFGST